MRAGLPVIQKIYVFIWRLSLLCVFCLGRDEACAQALKKFSSCSYNVREGLLNGRVLDLKADGNGFFWISTGAGLQRFDGRNFETVPRQHNLPQTAHLSLFRLNNGSIWLIGDSGITLYMPDSGRFRRIYDFSGPEEAVAPPGTGRSFAGRMIVPALESGKGVWCFNKLARTFFCIDAGTGHVEDSLALPEDMLPVNDTYVRTAAGRLLYAASGFALVEMDFRTKKILHAYNPPGARQQFKAFLPVTESEVIIANEAGLSRVNMATGKRLFSVVYPNLAKKHIENFSLTAARGGQVILSINSQFFAIDPATGRALYQLVDQQNGLFATPAYVVSCMTDAFDHLWAVTTSEGIVRINLNSLGIKYYGAGELTKNFNRCIYPDKKANVIITGSLTEGFSVYDTLSRLIKHFRLPDDAQASGILKIAPFRYLLFSTGPAPTVRLLETRAMRLTVLPESASEPAGLLYQTHVRQLSDSTAILFCDLAYFIVHFSKNKITFTKRPLDEEFSAAIIDRQKRIWLGQTGKYIVLSGKDFGNKTTFYLPGKLKIQCLSEDNGSNMWVGTEKGLYKINEKTGRIDAAYEQKDGLANDCIYSIISDKNDNIWCGTNKGVSGLYRKGGVLNIHSSDGLQGDEFNTNSCARSADGELFFGGVNGVSSFYPDSMAQAARQPGVLMTAVRVMDSCINGGPGFSAKQITLPYSSNIISFSFTAIGRYNPDEYTYRYRMDPIDKGWVNAGNSGNARYILPPGDYTFEYTAGNSPQTSLQHIQAVRVTIRPPFWRTGWFMMIIGLIVSFLIFTGIRLYDQAIRRRALRQMELRHTLQLERARIARDLHDHIGAYTTVLIAGAEKLSRDALPLRFRPHAAIIAENAKNIMKALRETIWVLDNEAITVTEFIDRFKVYAHQASRHWTEGNITFEERLAVNRVLGPTESLHLVRIMQEVLQNSLRHANAGNIRITVDSDAAFIISIKDDGTGFDADLPQQGNGLQNIRFRAKECGYELTISSGNPGTEVKLQKR